MDERAYPIGPLRGPGDPRCLCAGSAAGGPRRAGLPQDAYRRADKKCEATREDTRGHEGTRDTQELAVRSASAAPPPTSPPPPRRQPAHRRLARPPTKAPPQRLFSHTRNAPAIPPSLPSPSPRPSRPRHPSPPPQPRGVGRWRKQKKAQCGAAPGVSDRWSDGVDTCSAAAAAGAGTCPDLRSGGQTRGARAVVLRFCFVSQSHTRHTGEFGILDLALRRAYTLRGPKDRKQTAQGAPLSTQNPVYPRALPECVVPPALGGPGALSAGTLRGCTPHTDSVSVRCHVKCLARAGSEKI